MIDPQLEAGALEQLDGNGNPVAAPGEEELYRTSLIQDTSSAEAEDEEMPSPSTVALDSLEDVSGDVLGSDAGGDPLAYEQTLGSRPSQAKLVGAAGLYRVADLSETLTPEDVEEMLMTQVPHVLVQGLHDRLGTEDKEITEITQKMLLMNPNLSVESKLDTIRMMNADREPDVNLVQRAVATNVAEATYTMDDEDDDAEWRENALEEAEAIPKALSPYESRLGKDEAQRASVWAELDQLYKESDSNESLLDYVEMVTPVGSLPTLNATVSRIKSDLGMDSGVDTAITYTSVGSAMMELRAMIRQASPDQKADIARVVLNNLKQDTGLFQDSNDLVALQIIDNLFSKEISGTDAYAVDAVKTEGEDAALLDRLDTLNSQLRTATGPERGGIEHERAQVLSRLGGISGATVLDNVFNLLDVVGVGATARTTLRLGTKWVPNAWRAMFRSSPKLASRRMADAVERPEVAEQMGLSQADAINTGLPNAGVIERGANVLGELAQRQQDALEMVLRQAQPVNLTLAERGKALIELQDEVGALVQKKLPRGHVNLHTITPRADESGADIVAIFGKTKDRGYATLDGARKAKKAMVEEVFGKDAPTEVVKFNYGTNEFEVIDDLASGKLKGEFFVRAQDSRSYASTRNMWGQLNLGDDTVGDLALGAGVSTWTRGLNIFDQVTQGWISSRARAAKSAEGLGQGLMKPIADLPFQKKQMLSELVKKNEGRVLSDHDIRMAGGDDSVVEAYQTFRTVDDATYALVDYDLRNQYMREGLKDVVVNGQRAGWAKPTERLRASTLGDTKVFDPETGQHVRLTQSDINNMYASGESLGRLKFPMDGPFGQATHIKLSGKTTRVLPIPQRGVLPRIEGHYPHITQGNYVVSGITKNGERVALKMAATQSDAAEYVARRKALMASRGAKGRSTNFSDIVWELDHSLQNRASWGAKLDEVFTNNGGVLYGQRNGGQLGNLSKDFGDINVDPIQALLRGFNVATQHVTKGELVATMRQRLYNFLRSPENRNLFVDPTTSAQNLGVKNVNASHSNVKARDTAMAYAKQIELLESAPDAWREATKAVYNRMAYQAFRLAQSPFVARLGLKPAARKAEQMFAQGAKRGDNVVNAFMSAAHARYIAVMAPKQFVLQAAQSTMAIGLSSVQDFAKAWRQFGGISGATLMRMRSLHGGVSGLDSAQLLDFARKTSKVFGMEPDEMVKIVDTLVDSGLLDAVGHNSMIKEAIGEAAEKRMMQRASGTESALGAVGRAAGTASQVVKAPIAALSKIGFQGGENINQIISFLSLYNADKAKGLANLASDVYKDKLIGRVSELTGNMVAEASPQYTRSYLKPFTQWLQFQHKMILLTLPEKLGGSNILSGEEKIRTAFMQFLLYGSAGTATTTLIHKAVETQLVEKWEAAHPGEENALIEAWRSPVMKGVMDGFIADYTANAVLKALYGDTDKEWKEFAWGKAFAPGAGSEFLAERLIAIGTGDVEGMMGVNGQDFSKLRQFLKRTREVALAQWKDYDDVPFDARAEQLMKQGGAVALPVYGKYLAMQWALENDAKISAGGKVSEGFSNELEATLGLLLGVDTKDRAEFYEARDRLEGSFQKGKQDAVQELANTYWEQLVKNATVFSDKTTDEDLYDQMLTTYVSEQALMLSALDPRDKQAINEIISAKLQTLASGEGTTTELAFIKRITKKLEDGGYGADGPQVAVYLQSLDFAKKNPEMSVMIQQAVEAAMEDPQEQNMTTNEVAN